MRPHPGLTFLVLGLLAVTACSDSGTTPPETTTTVTESAVTDATTTSTTAAPAATLSIRIAAFAFSGDETGNVGDTVRIVNNDDFNHTWTSTDQAFHSGTLKPGEEFLHTFEQPGTFTYFCQIHPEMSGSITIEG